MDYMLLFDIERAKTIKELYDATLCKKLHDFNWSTLGRSDELQMQHNCDLIDPRLLPDVRGGQRRV